MRSRIMAVIAVGVALGAAPLRAQQGSTTSPPSQAAPQTSQSASNASSPTAQPNDRQMTGTITSLSANRLEVRVESVTGGASGAPTALSGRTLSFAFDTTTDMPVGLRAGDRVNIWFSHQEGELIATRVALAERSAPAAASQSPAQGSSTSPPAVTSTSGTEAQPSTLPGDTSGPGATGTGAAHTKALPKTASPLPLVGLIGLAALVAAVALRLVLKAT